MSMSLIHVPYAFHTASPSLSSSQVSLETRDRESIQTKNILKLLSLSKDRQRGIRIKKEPLQAFPMKLDLFAEKENEETWSAKSKCQTTFNPLPCLCVCEWRQRQNSVLLCTLTPFRKEKGKRVPLPQTCNVSKWVARSCLGPARKDRLPREPPLPTSHRLDAGGQQGCPPF